MRLFGVACVGGYGFEIWVGDGVFGVFWLDIEHNVNLVINFNYTYLLLFVCRTKCIELCICNRLYSQFNF